MTITIQNAKKMEAEGIHYTKNSKPVLCITTGKVYASVLDAAKALGVDKSCISRAVTGKNHKCKGMEFCLVKEANEHLDKISEKISKPDNYSEMCEVYEKRKKIIEAEISLKAYQDEEHKLLERLNEVRSAIPAKMIEIKTLKEEFWK